MSRAQVSALRTSAIAGRCRYLNSGRALSLGGYGRNRSVG